MIWIAVDRIMPVNRQAYLVANKRGNTYDVDYTLYKEEDNEYYRGIINLLIKI